MKRDGSSSGDLFGGRAPEVTPLLERMARREGEAGPASPPRSSVPPVRSLFMPPPAEPQAPPPPPTENPEVQRQIAEARAEAERAGMRSAEVKVQATMERYADAIQKLGEQVVANRPHAADVVSLAMVIAREILGRELRVDGESVVTALDEALQRVGNQPSVVVRLGRADLEFVRRRRPDLAQSGIELVLDDQLGAGGCIVEAPDQIVDASIESRLAAARDAVAAALDRDHDEPKLVPAVSPIKVAAC